MTIKEITDKILAYHPKFDDSYDGCDGFKSGNPDDECTGIVSALVPTVEVIKKTAELGCNLLYVHEPSYYSTPDYPDWRAGFENKIYEEKKALLDQYGIAVWRDHDHTHAHNPDGIFTGVIKYLGWEQYRVNADTEGMTMYFEFPDMTVEKMNALLKEKMCLNGIRYIGNPKYISLLLSNRRISLRKLRWWDIYCRIYLNISQQPEMASVRSMQPK